MAAGLTFSSRDEALNECRENNRVVVNIWTSLCHPDHPGASVGHVSVEFEHPMDGPCYFSLWPKQKVGPDGVLAREAVGKGFITGISKQFQDGYQQDLDYEGRPPELLFCFYSLDCDELVAAITELKESIETWSLLAITSSAESCVSSAFKLLMRGGLGNLVSKLDKCLAHSQEASRGSSQSQSLYSSENLVALLGIISPDGLAAVLKETKEKELERHHETQAFNFENIDGVKEYKPEAYRVAVSPSP